LITCAERYAIIEVPCNALTGIGDSLEKPHQACVASHTLNIQRKTSQALGIARLAVYLISIVEVAILANAIVELERFETTNIT
jgi:hypothetical protein